MGGGGEREKEKQDPGFTELCSSNMLAYVCMFTFKSSAFLLPNAKDGTLCNSSVAVAAELVVGCFNLIMKSTRLWLI